VRESGRQVGGWVVSNTHDENLESVDRYVITLEDIGKPKHSTTITSRTLGKNDNGSVGGPPNFLEGA